METVLNDRSISKIPRGEVVRSLEVRKRYSIGLDAKSLLFIIGITMFVI